MGWVHLENGPGFKSGLGIRGQVGLGVRRGKSGLGIRGGVGSVGFKGSGAQVGLGKVKLALF